MKSSRFLHFGVLSLGIKENENGETMLIKLVIRKQNVDWINLGQDRVHVWVLVNAVVNLRAPRNAELSNHSFLKTDHAV